MTKLDMLQPRPLIDAEVTVTVAVCLLVAAIATIALLPAIARLLTFVTRCNVATCNLVGVRRYCGERATVYQFGRFRLMVNRRKARKPRTTASVRELNKFPPLPRYVHRA